MLLQLEYILERFIALFTTKSYYYQVSYQNFTHIARNIFIINYLFSILQLISHTSVISYHFSLSQPFVWAYWTFLVFSQSSSIGSFCLSLWCFCTALCINRAWGLLSPLMPHWPLNVPELKGCLPHSPTMLSALRVAGVCVKVVGVQSGSLSHSLQHSVGLCCSDPSQPK